MLSLTLLLVNVGAALEVVFGCDAKDCYFNSHDCHCCLFDAQVGPAKWTCCIGTFRPTSFSASMHCPLAPAFSSQATPVEEPW